MSASSVGTVPVQERHRFDAGALRAWLAAHVDDLPAVLEVSQFAGGQSNPTYLLQGGGRRWVMRAKPAPAAKLLPSAHAIEREFRVMQALSGFGFPVARMIALCEDESVLGRAFYVMEHVEGRVFWDPRLPECNRDERASIYDEMNRVMALLHSYDPATLGLADFGRPGNYFARQIGRWSKQYQASETEKIPAMDELIAWLPGAIPAGDETTVVHGDFRLDNLIFHPTRPRVEAVLDWELSTLGHPLADFSYHCMAWHIDPDLFRGMAGVDLALLGIPLEPDYVASYCRRSGRERIAHWNFYLAYNMFRLAAILQGIMKRALDGTASSSEALAAGRKARPLAELGWKYAQKAMRER